nr:chorion specific transcription factor GCMb [Hymenolepis microstoma]
MISLSTTSPGMLGRRFSSHVFHLTELGSSFFTPGQKYKIDFIVSIPISPRNHDIDMSLVTLNLYSMKGNQSRTLSNTFLPFYRPWLIETIESLAFAPLYAFNIWRKEQKIVVSLSESFYDNAEFPTGSGELIMETNGLVWYTATLSIFANYNHKVMIIDSEDEATTLTIDESFQDKNNENSQLDGSWIENGVESSKQIEALHQSQLDCLTETSTPLISKNNSSEINGSFGEKEEKPKASSGNKIKEPISTIRQKRTYNHSSKKELKQRRKEEKDEESKPYDPPPGSSWNIDDELLPEPLRYDKIQEWIDGDTKKIFQEYKVHICDVSGGWVVRDASSENPLLMKKVCMGVLVCSTSCNFTGSSVGYRPASTEKAFKEQIGRCCPNPACNGVLVHVPCGGYNGTPVIQLWRFYGKRFYFQSMGRHNHARPQMSVPPPLKARPTKPMLLKPMQSPLYSAIPPLLSSLQITIPVNMMHANMPALKSANSHFLTENERLWRNISNFPPVDFSNQLTDRTQTIGMLDRNNVVIGQQTENSSPPILRNFQCYSRNVSIEVPPNLPNEPTDPSGSTTILKERRANKNLDDRNKVEVINCSDGISSNESDVNWGSLSIGSAPHIIPTDIVQSAPAKRPLHPFMIDAILAIPYESKSREKSHPDRL